MAGVDALLVVAVRRASGADGTARLILRSDEKATPNATRPRSLTRLVGIVVRDRQGGTARRRTPCDAAARRAQTAETWPRVGRERAPFSAGRRCRRSATGRRGRGRNPF